MAKVKTIYEFSEADVRRGLMLRFEELYGFMGVTPDQFHFQIEDSLNVYGDAYSPARISNVTVEV